MDKDKIENIWKKIVPDFENSNPSATYKSIDLEKGTITSQELPLITLTGGPVEIENTLDQTVGQNVVSGDHENKTRGTLTCEYKSNEPIKKETSASTLKYGSYEIDGDFDVDPSAETLNYELLDEIARGGMGIVFKGKQVSLQREVAIKKIKDTGEDSIKKDKFISESLITAYLDHPNIVPVYDLGKNKNEEVFLAMKLVGGTEWKNLLNPETKEEEELSDKYDIKAHLSILINVCNAIAYAHSKQIIHNDLKPSNVMVGEFGEVLVMDWGIAVDIRTKEERSAIALHRSMVKSPMGTPHYMPWELAEGSGKDIGPWTDVYLLGGILCHILTKKPPHMGGIVEALVSAVTGKLPTFPSDIPKELQQICHKALSKEITERYQNVGDFKSAIESYLQHSESLVISEKARKILNKCLEVKQQLLTESERNDLYTKFAQAVSGFDQALDLWKENEEAINGQKEARLSYANVALENGDFGLANAQISPIAKTNEIREIKTKINNAQKSKMQAEQAAKRLRGIVYVAIVLIIVGLTVGFLLVSKAQYELAAQKKTVEVQKNAIEYQKDAITKQLAEISLKKAEGAYKESLLDKEELNINSYMKQERAYRACGAYAGKALRYINELGESSYIKQKSTAFIKLALQKRKEIWRSPTYGYAQAVKFVTFVPNTQILSSVFEDDQVKFWNYKTGKEFLKFAEYTRKTFAIAFSSDGKTVACGVAKYNDEKEQYQNCTIELRDTSSGKKLNTFTGHTKPIKLIAFSANGKFLASSSGEKILRLWDVEKNIELAKISDHSGTVNSMTFSPDSKILASGSDDSIVVLSNVRTGKVLAKFTGHSNAITSIKFSPNGQLLASSSKDKSIRLWNVKTGEKITTLSGHTDAINSLAFSPDGKVIASGSSDSTVRLWNIKISKEFAKINDHIASVNSVDFSCDGKFLVSGSSDGTIRLWNTNTYNHHSKIRGHIDTVRTLAFSPDGKILASGSSDRTIRLWDTKTGKDLAQYSGHVGSVNSIAFSPDGKILASGSSDKTIRLWDTKTGKHTVNAYNDKINSVAFSPDGKILAFGSSDKTIRLWDTENHKDLSIIDGHTDAVNSITFSPDGKTIASGSSDTTIRLWNIKTGSQISKYTGHDYKVYSVVFSPDGQKIASSSGDEYGNYSTIKLWALDSKEEVMSFAGHSYSIYSIGFNPDGATLVSGSYDTTIRLWDVKTGKQRSKITAHNDRVYSVLFSPDGQKFASASKDNTVRLWDYASGKKSTKIIQLTDKIDSVEFSSDGKKIAFGTHDSILGMQDVYTDKPFSKLIGHSGVVYSVTFSADGKMLASGSGEYNDEAEDEDEEYQDCSVRLWSLKTQKEIFKFTGHTEPVKTVIFSPDSKVIASSSWDNTIRLWDIETGKNLFVINGSSKNVRSLAFSSDSKLIASSWDNIIKLWDAKTGKEITSFSGHSDDISALVFSPDGKILASGSNDKIIKLWNIETNTLFSNLIGHTSYVLSLAFSSDGRILASGCWDKTIRLWDVGTGKEFFKFIGHSESISSLAFSPNGEHLVSGSWDKTICLWDVTKTLTKTNLLESRQKITSLSLFDALNKKPEQLAQQLFRLKANKNMVLESYTPAKFLWDSSLIKNK
ncbi:protein kinase [Candidatus Uabimicrobium sp. HlEnr_7]|uniref:WD40 domain-containing protein n=1 Tax=Candidatus Uabimicrobium helgolandensis TaxID=3095367 RepID=UPI003555E4FB